MVPEKYLSFAAGGAVSILASGIVRGRILITPDQAAYLASVTVEAVLVRNSSTSPPELSDPAMSIATDAVIADIAARVTTQMHTDQQAEKIAAMDVIAVSRSQKQ